LQPPNSNSAHYFCSTRRDNANEFSTLTMITMMMIMMMMMTTAKCNLFTNQ